MENDPPAPAKRALAALDNPPAAADATMPARRISKRIIAAIDKMITGECKNITEAAEAVGLARESLSRALSKPHVAEHLRQRVLRHLAIASARAGATKVDLLDCDNAVARDRASSFILGLAGIPAGHHSVTQRQHRHKGGIRHRPDRRAGQRPAPADCFRTGPPSSTTTPTNTD